LGGGGVELILEGEDGFSAVKRAAREGGREGGREGMSREKWWRRRREEAMC